jgi:hypothetical protein
MKTKMKTKMKTNQSFKESLLKLFKEQMRFCTNCGELRTEVKIVQLPEYAKGLASFLEKDGIILYCKTCDTYGTLNPPEASL